MEHLFGVCMCPVFSTPVQGDHGAPGYDGHPGEMGRPGEQGMYGPPGMDGDDGTDVGNRNV